jgi:1,4-dihydroxy-2-naphthoyl-CoA hydrolase
MPRKPTRAVSPAELETPSLKALNSASGFLRALPIEFQFVAADRVVAVMELGPDHHTPWGIVHGGAYAAAVESAASVGATAAVIERGQIAVGVSNTTDFLRPVVSGRVRVVAKAIFQGATQQLWEVNITREDGKLAARGQLRLQNIDRPRE